MPHDLHIHVFLEGQSLHLSSGGNLLKSYRVSTSRLGPGFEEGSLKTPLGAFQVCEKFGDDAPAHTIFRARCPVGLWDPVEQCDDDLVLTRILRLEGLDPANLNTYDRYIYIHGTNHEELLGTPASQGCIRMSNPDVIDLYARTPLGTRVTISQSSP
jgi:hypothetical protein